MMETAGRAQSELTERRIAQYTLAIGFVAAVVASFLYSIRVGAGLLIGAVLAWVNFRWLERAMNAVARASTAQADSPEARVPISAYFALFARYALIAVVVYVIFSVFRIPVLSMVVGLCALGASAMLATLMEVLSPNSESH
jgi:small-conductance mechanosensitive channel